MSGRDQGNGPDGRGLAHHFFVVPALQPQPAQDELNRFCAGQRVLSVERRFVEGAGWPYWSVCVAVAPGPGPLPEALKTPDRRKASRIDYKERLSPEDFAVYAGLRAWRKTAAEKDGVPLFSILTNEQIASIAERRCATVTELGEIAGIGRARIERYGETLLEQVRAAIS